MSPIRQLSALFASYQFYATVMSPIRQLLALCNSHEVYATDINPIRQLKQNIFYKGHETSFTSISFRKLYKVTIQKIHHFLASFLLT